MPRSADLTEQIRANIHPYAHWAIADWDEFSWHKDSEGFPDTDLPQSSQALCISVWGTLAHPDADRARVALAGMLADPGVSEALLSVPELRLEFTDSDVLNERGSGNPTNIDALLLLPGLVLVVESKFTERFGSCSQVSSGHCTGRYEQGSDLKTRSRALCRLEVSDGRRTPRRYWDVMRALSDQEIYLPGRECPFAGPGYQIMRNIAFAAEYATRRGADWRTVFALPESLSPRSCGDVDAVVSLLREENRARVLLLDYELLAEALANQPDNTSAELSQYLSSRIEGQVSWMPIAGGTPGGALPGDVEAGPGTSL